MIQRIQSVYLLLTLLINVLIFFFDFATFTVSGNAYLFNVMGIEEGANIKLYYPYYLAASGAIALAIVAIISFSNRSKQLRWTYLNFLLHLATTVMLFINTSSTAEMLNIDFGNNVTYHVGFYLPVASCAFLFLAMRSIKNDEKLVKSIDRLR